MKYNLRSVWYSLDIPPTPSGFVLPNAMCYEEARAGIENSYDVEDECESVDKDICLFIMVGSRNILRKALLGSHTLYLNGNKKHLRLEITLAPCYVL